MNIMLLAYSHFTPSLAWMGETNQEVAIKCASQTSGCRMLACCANLKHGFCCLMGPSLTAVSWLVKQECKLRHHLFLKNQEPRLIVTCEFGFLTIYLFMVDRGYMKTVGLTYWRVVIRNPLILRKIKRHVLAFSSLILSSFCTVCPYILACRVAWKYSAPW